MVNNNGEMATAKVTKRARDNEGKPIGKHHHNPLLNTREYECILDDGMPYRYNANVIAENIFARCDDDGRCHATLKEITDHKKDHTAIDIVNGLRTTKRGKKIPKTTTRGWQLLCP